MVHLSKTEDRKGLEPEELSFLVGRPDHAYLDFEKMHQVRSFLTQESILLDRIYMSSCIEPMEFHRERYEVTEERLVRLHIEEDEVRWHYSIEIPWQFVSQKKSSIALQFEEWKAEKDIQLESDAMLHVRQKIEGLLDLEFFVHGAAPWQLFRKVKETGQVHLQIYPRHLKNVLYGLIQQNRLVVRNVEGGILFTRSIERRRMQNLINDIGRERFRAEFSMYYAGIIYLLILNRISCGFTREEMAFLMGQEQNYVKEMEELKIPAGNLEVMVHLSWVFNRRGIDISRFDNKSSYQFELTIWEEKAIRYYQMEYFINSVETMTFFQLMEEIRVEDSDQAEQFACDCMVVEIVLGKLIDMDYFKKYRTPLELWRYAEKYLGEKICIKSLMHEIGVFVGKKGSAPLRKTKAKSFGFRYIAHK